MNLIRRKVALKLGLPSYFTGKTCRRGHVAERNAANGDCYTCAAQKAKARRDADPIRAKRIHAEYRSKNREKRVAAHRVWRAANLERARAIERQSRRNHPIAAALRDAHRYAKERDGLVSLTPEELARVKDIYRQRDLLTKLTGEQYHVDHVLALANGGKHHPDNLQLLTATENRIKGAR